MREIKFRAWGKNSKEYLGYGTKDGISLTLKNIQNIEDLDSWIFEQSTGLKDKNGNSIWEGDLVSCGTIEGNPVGLVGFNTELGCWEVQVPNHAFGGENFGGLYCSEMEVVGNIHENPELLEEAK